MTLRFLVEVMAVAIYIWGTGCGASELIENGLSLERIAAFVDSAPGGEMFLGKAVLLPCQLRMAPEDLLIVTTRQADAVAARCGELGIPAVQTLFLKNRHTLLDRNSQCALAESVLGKELLNKLLPAQHVITDPAQLRERVLSAGELENDCVRLSTLELLCRRLKAVPGATAELGVYRGYFARCIQTLLPERKLYLFDSFAGFRTTDGAGEAFQAAHANTAVDRVLAILPHPERAVVKAGFFPESLNGLEERFCLVSLDVDFADTTLAGLRYFWPRLETGGYLLLHDWGNPKLPGVAEALEAYEAELGCRIPAVPLCDVGGTLVLAK